MKKKKKKKKKIPRARTVRVDLPEVGVLLYIARQQIDNIVIRDGRNVQSIDSAVDRRAARVISLGRGHNSEAVLRARRYDRRGAQRRVARVEEHVVLGEGVLAVARRLDIRQTRVAVHAVVLGMRLVEVVVRILAGVVAHATAYRHARDLEGRRLLRAALATTAACTVGRVGRRVACRDRHRTQRLTVVVVILAWKIFRKF